MILVFDGNVNTKLQEVFDYCKRENIFIKPIIVKENGNIELSNEVSGM